jgi:very-short-patch-repair endonuclease
MTENLSYKIITKATELFAGDTGFTQSEMVTYFCQKLNLYPNELQNKPEGNRQKVFGEYLFRFSKGEQKQILLELCEIERSQGYHSWPSQEQRQELASLIENDRVDAHTPIELLIFAATEKPDINVSNLILKEFRIPKKDDSYLIYEPNKNIQCVTWDDLLNWWGDTLGNDKSSDLKTKEKNLYERLIASLNPREKKFFDIYFKNFKVKLGSKFPALIPQVWLHYNRYSNEFRMKTSGEIPFFRQQIDFLLLLPPSNHCVLIEIDGKEHYSTNGKADEEVYASQVSYDRELKLIWNYEVYRFGNRELDRVNAESIVVDFFEKLLINKFKIQPSN